VVPAVVLVAAWLHHSPGADGPWPADRTGQTPARRVQLASANLNLQTTDHRALRAWLLSDGAPDVMALQEFTPSALAMVNAADVQAAYPHRLLEPRVDPFGLAVLSKHRLQSAQPVQPSDPRATLVLRLVLDVQGQHLAVSAVHPMPPLDAAYAQARDASLRAEARHLQATGLPGVLVGDLNDTPWSTGLRAALPLRRATGLAPTWPQAWGWLSLLPLDHVLVTPQLQVLNHGLGPDIGSDHRPVWVQLAL
jgi:endonuclease/exonuclease/phosphatase (EEP) superfamily protein YafD